MGKRLFFLLILLMSTHWLCAQNTTSRPKVGLVLSGGGAKGLAHIGIIRAMEKAGLTPDYITGTSMGSIVGGLYAMGYSADEIEQITNKVNWDVVLSNKIPLEEITMEEKYYYGRYIAELPMKGLKAGLPRGLIQGQKLSELLARITRPAHDIRNFRNLPIPFACVAADIATGEPVLLDSGSLPRAIRASMAIPTIFTPVEIGDHLLVDGGLVRNFPVEEVKAMGADIVIGVFVSSELHAKDQLDNLFSVLAQAAFVTSAFDSRKQKKMVDIYVEPDIHDFTTSSFRQWKQIIEVGDKTGEKFLPVFQHLADSLRQYGPLKKVTKLKMKKAYLITRISVKGNKRISSGQIIGKLKMEKGAIITVDAIEKQISLLYGTRFFDLVSYEIIPHGGTYELVIHVAEAPRGYLKMAVQYDSENDIGIIANVTYRNLLLPHSRQVAEINLSRTSKLNLNYLKYIGAKQNAGLQIGLWSEDNNLPFYENNIEISRFDARYSTLYGQLQSTGFQNFTFGGRFQLEYSSLKPEVGELAKVISRIQNRDISAVFYARYNNLDRRYFPTSGTKLSLSFKSVFDVKNQLTQIVDDSVGGGTTVILEHLTPFVATSIDFSHVFKLGKRFALRTDNSMRLTTLPEPDYNIADYYFVGGFLPSFHNVSSYLGAKDKEFVTPNYFNTRLTLQYEMVNHVFISGAINYLDVEYPMRYFYQITVDNYLAGQKRRFGYGLSMGYDSPLGPMNVAMAIDPDKGDLLASFNLGFWF